MFLWNFHVCDFCLGSQTGRGWEGIGRDAEKTKCWKKRWVITRPSLLGRSSLGYRVFHPSDSAGSSTEDSLDAFMTAVRSKEVMDSVERKKLHLHVADLRKDAQRLRKLIELTRPTQIPLLSKLVGMYNFKCYFLAALDLFLGGGGHV